MDELTLKGLAEIDGMKFNHIEGGFGESKKAMLVRDIAEIHNRELKDINRNINNNIKRFKNKVDIIDLKDGEFKSPLQSLGFSNRDAAISKNIYLLSERGYSKLLKILEDDFAWEQYDKLVDGYFSMREKIQTPMQELSPQLQLLINMELKQAEMETAITETNTRIDGLKDVIALDTTSWRVDTAKLITKMAHRLGGHEHIKDLRNESYDLLDARMGVSLSIRLTNKRRRMADEGVSVSKRNKLNYLDVIAEDKKLIEGYVAIVKEMAIKHDVAS